MRPIRVAVVGAGPAGIYAADILTREHESARVDVFDRLPAPYGLVRYGVAPDHPRIKEIIKALRRVLDADRIRFFGNVDYGTDLKLDDLKRHYDAVIFATGAMADRQLAIPGVELEGSHGAADFVSWYAGHPDVPREWPLDAQEVAVLGAGNVALDVTRMLAKPGDEQLVTEVAENVHRGLVNNKARTVHVFARRGPAHIKFSPMELRELSHSPSVEVLVEEDGFQIDDAGQAAIAKTKSVRLVVDGLMKYLEAEAGQKPRKIVIHMMHNPVEILGEDGKVVGLRTERMEYDGTGNVRGTGEFVDTPVQAVYRAIGYLSTPLADVPFADDRGVIPNVAGRVHEDDAHVPGVYVTGWIKRGPVGLIGHTKSDAKETVENLLADLAETDAPDREDIVNHLDDRAVEYTTVEGWALLDAHEQSLGEPHGRERVKVVPREEMIRVSRGAVS
ncbi:FAD-dependent oxidoreductase [Kineosporia succinea]|uniref:ferredoxin--NADP(+) reductase n=1 Tax=Kineosporia succinea TaxID=84632 RepID=A0ABT9NXC7_9ACTN|nr:FAD-dependent oxidoreductase [Kineosporia succinea]MDP9824971.1 ferredoxin--NADP+ reductase [Kineosporia succinea]